ncbi:MAG: peptide MFS transporter [Gammaproteobacteria bacterium]|nr:peptide MFS transporter [Gammaproteobacteria bacterium]
MNQPKGLWILFITEMWERFSYYGMRALLVLYLFASTDETTLHPGFGWSEENAYLLYGLYTWLVYLTPIFGGLIADRFIGTHRSMIVGGWIIATGHITLAATELFGVTAGAVVSLQSSPGALLCFLSGLLLIVIGTGFFKPCVSVMVGQLYEPGDERRDGGFTIFYMGINVGAVMSPLIAGTLGETVGWHWGFGSAAVGMILGILVYQYLRPRYLEGIGLRPERPTTSAQTAKPTFSLSKVEWQRIGVILVLAFVGNIAFWTAFEQAGSSMNVFAAQSTDRTVWGLLSDPFPATWYQAANPAAVIIFAPVFAWLWIFLSKRNLNPSTPMKFALGLWLLGLAFLAMVFGAMEARDGGLAGPHWLLITYVAYTWGELCLSPVGLSMVTKLAPLHLQSFMMGMWFFSFSISNLLAGLVARYSIKLESGESTFVIDGLAGFYLLLVVAPLVIGTFIWLISPVLRRWMHGVK